MPEGPTPLPLIQCNPGDEPRYYWNENKPKLKYSSVTAVLSATQPKESKVALRKWGENITKEGGDPAEELKAAAKRGSEIHQWFEPWLLRRNPAIPKHIREWCLQIKAAPLWGYIDYVISTEQAVCSHEGILPYAGTYDALLKIGEETVLFDLKTKGEGKGEPTKAVCNEALCQMAAYRECLKENHDVEVNRFIALYVYPDRPSFPVFAAGEDLEHHKKQWEKRLSQYADLLD